MNVPLDIHFNGIDRTPDVDELILEQVRSLERACSNLSSCRIAIDKQSHKQPYHVRVELTVPPGHRLVISRDPGKVDSYDLRATIRNAFVTAERELKELVEKRRGDVKSHPEQQPDGFVVRLFPDKGYGFLRSRENGREIYFHKNAVANGDFERLEIGTGVAFTEEPGIQGPQASTVRIVDKPGPPSSHERRTA